MENSKRITFSISEEQHTQILNELKSTSLRYISTFCKHLLIGKAITYYQRDATLDESINKLLESKQIFKNYLLLAMEYFNLKHLTEVDNWQQLMQINESDQNQIFQDLNILELQIEELLSICTST